MDTNRPPADRLSEQGTAAAGRAVQLNVDEDQKPQAVSPRETVTLLERLARTVIAAPRRMLAVVLLLTVAAAIFGGSVSDKLLGGGFQDPAAESFRAAEALKDDFGVTNGKRNLLLPRRSSAQIAAASTGTS